LRTEPPSHGGEKEGRYGRYRPSFLLFAIGLASPGRRGMCAGNRADKSAPEGAFVQLKGGSSLADALLVGRLPLREAGLEALGDGIKPEVCSQCAGHPADSYLLFQPEA
jgi:hypothetical protein